MVKNKLSIFLIKKEYSNFNEIIDAEKKAEKIDLGDNQEFYYNKSFSSIPFWINNFFETRLDKVNNIKSSSAKGILLLKVNVTKKTKRIFAVSFGYGRSLINKKCIEERFGLKTVLNIIDADSIRRIDKKDISSVPKHSIEQRSKVGNRLDFGINIEQELIQGITGLVKKKLQGKFGKNVTGTDSLSLTIDNNLSNIDAFLVDCYKKYNSKDYKTDFDWIDQIKPIKNKKLIDKLNEKLILEIKKDIIPEFVWMAVPEVIDWEDVEGFSYINSFESLTDDIFLQEWIKKLFSDDKEKITFRTLESKHISAFDSNKEEKYKWSVYECIYAEVKENKKTFLLSNGSWFEIESTFVDEINKSYNQILDKTSTLSFLLPDCEQKTEGEYNAKVAEEENIFLMDKKNISYGGGHSSIEFCDLITNKKEFIHVKRYGGSSVLSHLFNQGLVPSELIKTEIPFIKKVNEKLDENYKLPDVINASEYKIIFAIISKSDKNLSIPFFSKIALKNVKRRLEALGYNVYLEKIKQTYSEENNDESKN